MQAAATRQRRAHARGGESQEAALKLEGKSVVITGASGEIGQAVALELARAGAKLVLHYRSNAAAAEKLRQDALAAGASAGAMFGAELSSSGEASALMSFAAETFGDITALICLSGGVVGSGSISTTDDQAWRTVLDANLMTTVHSIRAAVPLLSREKSRIVITASIRGMPMLGRESAIGYSAAKAALITLGATIAKELGPATLVNTISPGFVWTKNYEKLGPELYNTFVADTVLNRFITPSELAPAYRFLCETDIMTGQNLVVDGGYALKL